MTIDPEKLMALRFPEIEHRYDEKHVMLYALGLGLGADPTDPAQLRYVYEDGLRVLPTFATMLAYPGAWARDLDTGIDYLNLVHGEQRLRLHAPLPAAATVTGRMRVTGLIDKGAGRGALVFSERVVRDKATGARLATVSQTTFCRGDGGLGDGGGGAFGAPPPRPHGVPERPADACVDIATRPEAALIYRLSGDLNPLHADPATARAAGFARPILHGLATYGIAGRAVLDSACANDPARLAAFDARFTAPVFPGETLKTEIWIDGAEVSFRTSAPDRDAVVLDNGRAEIAP